mmetsp:Transcript_9775/g.36454  ORF Transcript_9775/g.36454 Transcript_9775/m.36454 type:complete len:194 (+) Transcript_9775:811-1392(+)
MEKIYDRFAANLTVLWTDLLTEDDDPNRFQFWEHEWKKHGSCSKMKPEDYFEATLAVRSKIHLVQALDRQDIVPNDEGSYRTGDLESAIQKVHGVKPAVVCKSMNKKHYLTEIHMCTDLNFGVSVGFLTKIRIPNSHHRGAGRNTSNHSPRFPDSLASISFSAILPPHSSSTVHTHIQQDVDTSSSSPLVFKM